MSVFSKIKEMDKVFSWSFFGFLLAVFFGGVSIYLGFIKENKPSLQYVVTSNSNVLDIKERLGSLDVLYEGESLSKSNRDLRIITFQVINKGDAPVLPNYYDPVDPIGFFVSDGDLADSPSLVRASSQYLKEKTILTKTTNNSVTFSNVILEPGDSIEVRVLVLYSSGKSPSIKAFGKIANVSNISVVEGQDLSGDKSSWLGAFSGGYHYQVVRLFSYGLAFFGLFVALVFLIVQISESVDKRVRVRKVKAFKDFDNTKIVEADEFFFDLYKDGGVGRVQWAFALISNSRRINRIYGRSSSADTGGYYTSKYRDELEVIERLKVLGVLFDQDGTLVVAQDRILLVSEFISYLERKGEVSRYRFGDGAIELSERFENKINDEIISARQDASMPDYYYSNSSSEDDFREENKA